MELGNGTRVKEFIFLGLTQNQELSLVLFLFLLLVYVTTMLGNLLIMVTVTRDSRLHTPMYIFLGNFSFLEICYVTTTIPNMLANFLSSKKGSPASLDSLVSLPKILCPTSTSIMHEWFLFNLQVLA